MKTSKQEMKKKWKFYNEVLVPFYKKEGKEVPPHLEPDYFEGWNTL